MNADKSIGKDVFLSPQETSDLTGFSLKSLSNNRSQKIGFPYYKYSGKIFYKESEVLKAIEDTKVDTKTSTKAS